MALFVGLRPAPLKRYRELVLEGYGAAAVDRIRTAREAFEHLKTELVERNLRLVLKVARQFSGGPLSLECGRRMSADTPFSCNRRSRSVNLVQYMGLMLMQRRSG